MEVCVYYFRKTSSAPGIKKKDTRKLTTWYNPLAWGETVWAQWTLICTFYPRISTCIFVQFLCAASPHVVQGIFLSWDTSVPGEETQEHFSFPYKQMSPPAPSPAFLQTSFLVFSMLLFALTQIYADKEIATAFRSVNCYSHCSDCRGVPTSSGKRRGTAGVWVQSHQMGWSVGSHWISIVVLCAIWLRKQSSGECSYTLSCLSVFWLRAKGSGDICGHIQGCSCAVFRGEEQCAESSVLHETWSF